MRGGEGEQGHHIRTLKPLVRMRQRERETVAPKRGVGAFLSLSDASLSQRVGDGGGGGGVMHSADARRITTHFWREKILQYFWTHLAAGAGGGGAGDVNILY